VCSSDLSQSQVFDHFGHLGDQSIPTLRAAGQYPLTDQLEHFQADQLKHFEP
jgi:hypothetical protein